MANKDIKGFTFYRSYFDALEDFSEKEQKEFLFAMINYIFKDDEPGFKDRTMKVAWVLIKPLLDKSKNKSNVNAGAKIGNQNAKKEETIEKQSNNNQTYQDISKSISLYLNNIIILNINNKNSIYNLFIEYINIRYKYKYTISDTILKRLVKKLNEYSKTDEDKIEILEQAINGAWKDFYKLEESKKKEEVKYETI